ncbi:MAG: cytochrome bc1 complex diheme cytochrome c subunit [Actinomycetota bacterium]
MRLRRLAVLGLLSLVPTSAIQLLARSPSPAMAQVDQQAARGFDLFVAGCAACHGVEGQGTGQGPPLVGVGAAAVDFMLSTGRMPLSDPGAQPVRSAPEYSSEEIAAIVAYVGSVGPGGPAIPVVFPENGDLSRGRELYAANCLACHGAGGQGASVGGGAVAPGLDRATPTEIAEAVRIGPGGMPPFTQGQLSESDMDSVVRYVLFVRQGEDRGGLGLGHVGPVVEGLMGWLVGLGILLLVVRLTGSSR